MYTSFAFEMVRPSEDLRHDITVDNYIVLKASQVSELEGSVEAIRDILAKDVPYFMIDNHFRIVTDECFDSLREDYQKNLDEISHLNCTVYPDGTSRVR